MTRTQKTVIIIAILGFVAVSWFHPAIQQFRVARRAGIDAERLTRMTIQSGGTGEFRETTDRQLIASVLNDLRDVHLGIGEIRMGYGYHVTIYGPGRLVTLTTRGPGSSMVRLPGMLPVVEYRITSGFDAEYIDEIFKSLPQS